MQVWVLIIYQGLEDPTISVHTSSQKARDYLWNFVCENWDNEAMGGDIEDDTEEAGIDRFFEFLHEEFSYKIEQKKLLGSVQIVEEEDLDKIFVSEEELLMASLGLQHVNIEDLAKETGLSPQEAEDKVIEIAKKLG